MMEKKKENLEHSLQSKSLEEIDSCSSSILDSEEEDGINVTLKAVVPSASAEDESGDPAFQKLAGSERRKIKKMIVDGMELEVARAKVTSSTPKRLRNTADSPTGGADIKPDSKKVCGPAAAIVSAAMKSVDVGGIDLPDMTKSALQVRDVVMEEIDGDQEGGDPPGSGGDRSIEKKKKKKKKNNKKRSSVDAQEKGSGGSNTGGTGAGSGVAGAGADRAGAVSGGAGSGADGSGVAGSSTGGAYAGSAGRGDGGKPGSSSSGLGGGKLEKKKSSAAQGGSGNKKPRRENFPAPTCAQIASRVKLGIVPTGYPDVELTSEQQEVVKKELLKKVLEQRKEKFKPKFVYCKARTGHVMLSCQDRSTADWVKRAVSTVAPWENAQLCALEEADMPRKEALLAFFYRSKEDDNDTILGYLESQNDDLDTSAWRILHRTVKNDHVNWVFTVDSASMQLLEEREFVVNFKYGITKFWKKRSVNGNHPDEDASDEEMEVDPMNEAAGGEMTQGKVSLTLAGKVVTNSTEHNHNHNFTGGDTGMNPRALTAQGSNGEPSSETSYLNLDLSGKDCPINPRALIAQGSEGDPSRLEITNNANQGDHQPKQKVPKEPHNGGEAQQ